MAVAGVQPGCASRDGTTCGRGMGWRCGLRALRALRGLLAVDRLCLCLLLSVHQWQRHRSCRGAGCWPWAAALLLRW